MHHLYDLFLGIGWLLFWLYWFISAANTKKNRSSNLGRWAWVRLLILVAFVLLFRVSGDHGVSQRSGPFTIHGVIIDTIGVILFVVGLMLAIWARVHIGRNWGMPMTQKEEPHLVTSGPYARIRHPIYTGILTAMLGTSLMVSIYGGFVFVVAAIYFIFSATREEAYLAREFPKTFPSYKQRTKMLVPYLL